MTLNINNLSIKIGTKNIIPGLNLKIKKGEVHVLMGPNGSGKSSLSFALMGHPDYQIDKGSIFFDKQNITNLTPEEKSRLGLFLSFQKPISVPGVCYLNLLRISYLNKFQNQNKTSDSIKTFLHLLKEKAQLFKISEELVKKEVNFNMSGGEQKKMEMLTLSLLSPQFAILDEIDTGLDVDALKTVSSGLSILKKEMGILLITHNPRILKYLKPDFIHIMIKGQIVKTGNYLLANEIEKNGYAYFHNVKIIKSAFLPKKIGRL